MAALNFWKRLNRKQKKQQQKQKKYPTKLNQILAETYFQVIEQQDLRLLLFEYDEDYPLDELEEAFAKINDQLEELGGDKSVRIREARYELIEKSNLVLMYVARLKMILGREEAIQIAKEAGVDIKDFTIESLNEIDRKMYELQTQLEIEAEYKKEGEVKPPPFQQMVWQIEKHLKRELDLSKVTLIKWHYIVKDFNKAA